MISFNKPTNLNGAILIDELNAAGITLSFNPLGYNNQQLPQINADGLLWLAIEAKDEDAAKVIVEAHNG